MDSNKVTNSGNSLNIVVCKGPACCLMEAGRLQQWCGELAAAGLNVHCDISPCTGNCTLSPVIQWNGRYITECTPEKMTALLIEEDHL